MPFVANGEELEYAHNFSFFRLRRRGLKKKQLIRCQRFSSSRWRVFYYAGKKRQKISTKRWPCSRHFPWFFYGDQVESSLERSWKNETGVNQQSEMNIQKSPLEKKDTFFHLFQSHSLNTRIRIGLHCFHFLLFLVDLTGKSRFRFSRRKQSRSRCLLLIR